MRPVHDQIIAKYYSQLQEGFQGFHYIRMTGYTSYQAGQEDDLQVGRILLVNGQFYTLGLLTPLIVRGKILLKHQYGPAYELGCDDPLLKEEQS